MKISVSAFTSQVNFSYSWQHPWTSACYAESLHSDTSLTWVNHGDEFWRHAYLLDNGRSDILPLLLRRRSANNVFPRIASNQYLADLGKLSR